MANRDSRPYNISVTGITGGTATNCTAIGINNEYHNDSLLQNMTYSTKLWLETLESDKHITTYAERSALRLLRQYGSLFITGRSGSGKSSLGRRLLSAIEKETKMTPIVLSSPNAWHSIPKREPNTVRDSSIFYVVMIDDIFGSSNLVESRISEWETIFDVMWPSVKDQDIFLVVTSRSEISALCKNRIMRYDLFQNIQTIDLDSGRYTLKAGEKREMIRKYCGKYCQFSKNDLHLIASTTTALGFPQCCRYFISSQTARDKGVEFFTKPTEFLLSEVERINECDQLGYFILGLIIFSNGFLDTSERNASQLRKLKDEFKEYCRLSRTPSLDDIKSHAKAFSGSFINITDKGMDFTHHSIFEAVFLFMARTYPQTCIRLCPVDVLLEYITVEQDADDDNQLKINIEEGSFPDLADRITELFRQGDNNRLFSHNAFKHEQFVKCILQKWTDEKLLAEIMKKQISYSDVSGMKSLSIKFQPTNILTHLILINSPILPTELLGSEYSRIHKHIPLDEVLSAAIYENKNDLIQLLLQKRVRPTKYSLFALCAANNVERQFADAIIKKTGHLLGDFAIFQEALCVAALSGNVSLIDVIMSKSKDQDHLTRAVRKCIFALLYKYSGVLNVSHTVRMKIKNTLKCLIPKAGSIDKGDALQYASSHIYPDAMCVILENIRTGINCAEPILHCAVYFGGIECVKEALKYGPDVNKIIQHFRFDDFTFDGRISVLHLAARSAVDSYEKTKLLCENMTDVVDELNSVGLYGMSALHYAVEYGNVPVVDFLIKMGSDVNLEVHQTITPLYVLTRSNKFVHFYETSSRAGMNQNFQDMSKDKVVQDRKVRILKALVENGATLDESSSVECLRKVADMGDEELLRFLQTKGLQMKTLADALIKVAEWDSLESVKFLCGLDSVMVPPGALLSAARSSVESHEKVMFLADHVPIDVQNGHKESAIFGAVCADNWDVFRFLLQSGLDVSAQNKDGDTVLHVVCSIRSDLLAIDNLVSAGVDVNIQNLEGKTALHVLLTRHAVAEETTELFSRYFYQSDYMNYVCQNVRADLYVFVESRYKSRLEGLCVVNDQLKLLLRRNPDINFRDSQQRTALHAAARNGHIKCVKTLLEYGFDANATDIDGNSVLHLAIYAMIDQGWSKRPRCKHLSYSLWDCLIASGADPEMSGGPTGSTALQRFQELSDVEKDNKETAIVIAREMRHIGNTIDLSAVLTERPQEPETGCKIT